MVWAYHLYVDDQRHFCLVGELDPMIRLYVSPEKVCRVEPLFKKQKGGDRP
ncbi:hypothetical protein [Suicoccus acidiformans]|uniref:hypothetical protein n=1 Tax=Suicoccus acidiformans TaxID=2036206 RepID=UPI0013C2DEA8|nr:hypothetical protein [Suicoccus acidiformans]